MTTSRAYRIAPGLALMVLGLLASCGDDAPAPEDEQSVTADASTTAPREDASNALTGERDSGAVTGDAGLPAASDRDASGQRDADAPVAPRADAGQDAGRDGGAQGTPDGGGPSTQPLCLEAGDPCNQGTCCAGAICVVDGQAQVEVCAATCQSGSDCVSGCCASVGTAGAKACAPASYCVAPPPPPVTLSKPANCGTLELNAADDEFLGIASGATTGDSVCAEFGTYGGAYGSSSIFNTYGTYGSAYGANSAYNPYSATPPAITCSDTGTVVALVTKNKFAAGGIKIDPDVLCETLAANGW